MSPLHSKRRKFACLWCGKISENIFLLAFVGLALYVGCILFLSISKISIIVDMSTKMRSNVVNVLNSIANLNYVHDENGTSSLKSLNVYENKTVQKEKSGYVTGDKSKSFITNNSIQADNKKENNVKTYIVDVHSGKENNIDKVGNNLNRRQNNCTSCFLHNFNYLIQNKRICTVGSPNQNIDLIVLIMTTHDNIRERTALRSTWLSYTKNNTSNVRYVFLLGDISNYTYQELVLQENSVFHDIIKEDFVDTYMNLTYKTIMGFKWAATYCKHAHYLMKTDDDMFVNIPNVLKIIKGPNSTLLQTSVVGACHAKASPIRNKKSKWFASEGSYPEKFYPGFCSGTGYMTSMHVANEVYKISPSVPFFHLEDVYVSLCIKALGFKLKALKGFNTGRPQMDPCFYKGEILITAHQLTPVMLQKVWSRHCNRETS